MRRIRSIRNCLSARLSWKRRVVACWLLLLSLFLVINPLWECHDHLDDLRHLGPHGVLLIMLIVACAGISLIKSLDWLKLFWLPVITARLQPLAVLRWVSHDTSALEFAAPPAPLRI